MERKLHQLHRQQLTASGQDIGALPDVAGPEFVGGENRGVGLYLPLHLHLFSPPFPGLTQGDTRGILK